MLDRQEANEVPARTDEAGFTMLELLVVVVILGLLAAIVMFTAQGASAQSWTASCASDSKTVNIAASVYLQQYPHVTQVTQSDLTSGTGQSLSVWPKSTKYSILIAGDGNSLSGSTSDDAQPALIADNDVLVKVGSSYFDATKDPGGACSAT